MGGKRFFVDWALWQKMTFVLACGITVTIVLGFIKLFFDRSKLRKYSKVEKGKQAQTPEMLESQPVTTASVESKDEIPFGIRAIQSGIEVDGVWISRTNTPVASSRASIISESVPRSYNNNPQLELPGTTMHGSSRTSSRAPSTFDRAVSAERIPTNGSRSSSPGRGRVNIPQKCSNCNHNIPKGSAALDSPRSVPGSGPPSPPNGTHGESSQTSNKSSRRTSDESDYMAISQDVRAYETAYIRPASTQAPNDPRTDLDLLQSHRLSHVAETGQLTPRVRKPGHSGDWATTVAEHQVSSVNGVNYFVPQKTPSPPLPPIIDPMEEIAVASSSNPTQDGHSANQARQAVPLMESYAPKAAYYPDTYQPRGPHHQYSYDEVPYEVNTDQNQRESQVLRKVNDGFEILRPGTFHPPTPEEVELSEKRQSKKLQKKRRTSGDSRQSAFIEQV